MTPPKSQEELERESLEHHVFIVVYEFLYKHEAIFESGKNLLSKKIKILKDSVLYSLITLVDDNKLNAVLDILQYKKGEINSLKNIEGTEEIS